MYTSAVGHEHPSSQHLHASSLQCCSVPFSYLYLLFYSIYIFILNISVYYKLKLFFRSNSFLKLLVLQITLYMFKKIISAQSDMQIQYSMKITICQVVMPYSLVDTTILKKGMPPYSILIMETVCFSKTLIPIYTVSQSQDSDLHNHCHESLISHILFSAFSLSVNHIYQTVKF